MKRPVVWCTALFACGTAVRLNFSVGIVIVFICCILYTAASYRRISYLLLIPVFFLGMLPSYIYEQKYLEPLKKFENRETELVFRVTDRSLRKSSGGYWEYTVKTSSADGSPLSSAGRLYCPQKFSVNDIVSAKARIFPVSAQPNPGNFNYRINQINKGLAFSSYTNSGEITGTHDGGIIDRIMQLRRTVISRLKAETDPKVFGFLSAILTGDRENLTSFRNETFRKLGLSHIMAVSGFHVSALLGFIYLLLDLLRIKRLPRNIVCTLFLLFLLPFMNFSPSAARAVIMSMVMLWSTTFKKDTDSLSSLSFAALVILIFRPFSLKDISFVLSFTAAGGIILLSPVIQKFFERIFKNPLPTLSCVLAVHIFLLPASIYYFGGSSLLSIPANLIFVPVFPAIMFLLVITLVFGGIIGFLPYILNLTAGIYLGAIETAARLTTVSYRISVSDSYVFALIIILALAAAFKGKMRKLFAAAALILSVFIGMNIFQMHTGSRIIMASQGGIYGAVIKTPEATCAAVFCNEDTGKYDYNNFKSILTANNIKDIDIFKFLNYNKNTDALKERIKSDFSPEFSDNDYHSLGNGMTVGVSGGEITVTGEEKLLYIGSNPADGYQITGKAGNPEITASFDNQDTVSFENGYAEITFNKEKITGMKVKK